MGIDIIAVMITTTISVTIIAGTIDIIITDIITTDVNTTGIAVVRDNASDAIKERNGLTLAGG